MAGVTCKVVISGNYWKKDKTFPGLNDYLGECARHPKAGGRIKRDYEMLACNAIRRSLKRWKPEGLITLHYRFYEPNKGQIRDHMNVFSFCDKVFQDALVACRIIPDDSPKYVDGNRITHQFFYTGSNPYIEIEIEELAKEDG